MSKTGWLFREGTVEEVDLRSIQGGRYKGRIGPRDKCSSEHVYAFSLVKIGLLDKSALHPQRVQ